MKQILYSSLHGLDISSGSGQVGSLKDILVEDHTWLVRHLVAQTGSWYSRRTRLVAASAIEAIEWGTSTIRVTCNPAQWPELEPPLYGGATRSNCGQLEHNSCLTVGGESVSGPGRHLGWEGITGREPQADAEDDDVYGIGLRQFQIHRDVPSWRSIHDILGYEVKASDGYAGSITDVILTDSPGKWAMTALIIRLGSWPAQRCVQLHPENVGWISWDEQCLSVALTRAEIQQGAPFEQARKASTRSVSSVVHGQ